MQRVKMHDDNENNITYHITIILGTIMILLLIMMMIMIR